MNFSYGIIGAVGVLAAISIGFIVMDPTDVIEPRIVMIEENPVVANLPRTTISTLNQEAMPEPETMLDTTASDESFSILEPEAMLKPTPATVSIPAGTGVPGCEDTDECYMPYEITISAGATVFWINDDPTIHTITSRDISDTDVAIFDSGLLASGSNYEFTFNDAGTFDYYCIVHPWMTGIVNVD